MRPGAAELLGCVKAPRALRNCARTLVGLDARGLRDLDQ